MTFRRATIDDVHHLTHFVAMAYGGCNEAIYEELISNQSIEQVLKPLFLQPGTTPYFENHWVFEEDGQVVGGLHAFPFDDFANDPPDHRVPEERFVVMQPFANMPVEGAYFINALSVYPEHGGKGIGLSLLKLAFAHAREKAYSEMALHVYGENTRAVELYERNGFRITNRQPVVEHPRIPFKGEAYLMMASI